LFTPQVAWLEKRFEETGDAGFCYEEIDVRSFDRTGISTSKAAMLQG
jgi:hypothetical protein